MGGREQLALGHAGFDAGAHVGDALHGEVELLFGERHRVHGGAARGGHARRFGLAALSLLGAACFPARYAGQAAQAAFDFICEYVRDRPDLRDGVRGASLLPAFSGRDKLAEPGSAISPRTAACAAT